MRHTSLKHMSSKQLEAFVLVNKPIIKNALESFLKERRINASVKVFGKYNGHIEVEITGLKKDRYFQIGCIVVGTKVMNFTYLRPKARVTQERQECAMPGGDKLISLSRAIGAIDNLGFHNMQVAVDAMEEAKSISHFEQELIRVLDGFHVVVKSLFKNADWNSK